MSNPARAKGTRYEVALLHTLRHIWPDVERAPLKGIHDAGDYVSVPLPIEAKNTQVLNLPVWVRRLAKIGKPWWVLFWAGGDQRKKDALPELAVMPADMARVLLDSYQRHVNRWDVEDAPFKAA